MRIMSIETGVDTRKARPFLKWAGGKTQLLYEIENRLPNKEIESGLIDTYIEPFVGGGTVFSHCSTLCGWRLDTLNAIAKIPLNIFKLDNVYDFKKQLQELHPENRNIEAKIRQQLQELRDLGLLEFLGKGIYRKLRKDS